MKVGIGAYVILSGAAIASYGAAVDDAAFVAASHDAPHLMERRALGFLSNLKLPQVKVPFVGKKSEAAAPTPTQPAAAPAAAGGASTQLSQLVAKGINTDVKAIIDSVISSAKGVDIPVALKKYGIPFLLAALKELQQFTGERLLNHIASVKGKSVLDYFRKFDTGLIWQAYKDFNVAPVVNTLFGQDMSPFIAQLQKQSGADAVEFVRGLSGPQVGAIVAGALQMFKAAPILESVGISVQPLVKLASSFSGAQIIKFIEGIDGAKILDFVASLDGTALINVINQYASAFLSQVRQVASQMLGGELPPVYKDFDLFRVVDATQALVEELSGLKFPSVSGDIKSFSGAAYLQQIKQLDFSFLVEIALIAQEAALLAAKDAAKYAGTAIAKATGGNTALTKLLSKMVDDLRAFNGDKLLQFIKNLDAKAVAKTIKELGVLQVVRVLTTADLTPYVDAFANFNGASFLTNVQNLSKERLAKYLQDVGFSQYVTGFTGIPAAEVVQWLESGDGEAIMKQVKMINGEDIYKLLMAIATSRGLGGGK